jgi:hypothetical protein
MSVSASNPVEIQPRPARDRWASHFALWLAPLLVAAACLVVLWPHWNAGFDLPADTVWLIHAGKEMLAGKTLYRDILETNPPMSVLLYMPGLILAELTGLSARSAVLLQMAIVAALSMALSLAFFLRAGLVKRAYAGWIGMAILFCFAVLPNHQATQREHFAAMLLLPYIALMASHAAARPVPGLAMRIGMAVLAGIAAAIKPHFLIVPALMTLVSAFMTRSPRPLLAIENIVGGLVFTAYSLGVLILFPAFGEEMWPILGELYLEERSGPLSLLMHSHMARFIQPFMLICLLCAMLVRSTRAAAIWFAPALGCLAMFLIQGKGFIYHFYPAAAFAVIAMAVLAASQTFRNAGWRMLAGLACLFAALVGTLSQNEAYPRMAFVETLRAFPHGTPVIIVADSLHRSIKAADYADLHWASRLHTRWMTMIADAELREADLPAERRAAYDRYRAMDRRILIEDIETRRPILVLFDRIGHDWETIMRRDPSFEQAMSSYVFAGRRDSGTISFYIRRDANRTLPETP